MPPLRHEHATEATGASGNLAQNGYPALAFWDHPGPTAGPSFGRPVPLSVVPVGAKELDHLGQKWGFGSELDAQSFRPKGSRVRRVEETEVGNVQKNKLDKSHEDAWDDDASTSTSRANEQELHALRRDNEALRVQLASFADATLRAGQGMKALYVERDTLSRDLQSAEHDAVRAAYRQQSLEAERDQLREQMDRLVVELRRSIHDRDALAQQVLEMSRELRRMLPEHQQQFVPDGRSDLRAIDTRASW